MKDIFEVLQKLQETNIPNLLVIAGIIFLLLSLAGRVGGFIELPPTRQRGAGIIGGILLVVGIGLAILPGTPADLAGVATITPDTPTVAPLSATNTPVPPPDTATPEPTPTPLPPTDTATPEPPTNTPSATPTDTPTATPTPTPLIIDTMDSTLEWEQYGDDQGSSMILRSTAGMIDNAAEISFDLKANGYVGIAKEFYPGILSGTKAIKFSYNGSGAPNTIELKLLYAPDSNGKSAVFGASWHHITATNTWKTFEVPYTQFGCWVETGCAIDETVDLTRVWKVDFAISNKLGDTPGIGIIAIDNVQGVNSPQP